MLYEERSDGKGAKSNSYVDNLKSPREKRKFSTWTRNETSEESNETSEESKRPHVENEKYPRSGLTFPTWLSHKTCNNV